MRFISWFAGIGGFDLGLERAGHTPVAYSEIDPYACAVYEKRFPGVPNLGSIHDIRPEEIPVADLWCGGFPCQPFSVAGKRQGARDDRDLWPVWSALISAARPRFLLAENVPGLLSVERGRYFGRCVRDLAAAGYVVEWAVIGADDIGAPHRRKRLWIWAKQSEAVAEAGRELSQGKLATRATAGAVRRGCFACPAGWAVDPADVADSESQLRNGSGGTRGRWSEHSDRCPFCGADQGPASPLLGRVAHGIPHRVHRLRCLGNAVVPQVVEWIGRRIG